MNNDTVVSLAAPARISDPLTELLRTGARRLIEAAVSAEFEEYLSGFVQEQLPDGRQRVVRNGHLPERKILTGVGEVDVRVPKARSRSGSPEPFRSSVVPPYVRRCASLDAAIPWLYPHGVSTGQMRQAVGALVGEEAARGLSANVVSRLKRSWDEEYRQWCRRRLDDEWVYLWADGIYSGLRSERERLCVLVVVGVNARGEKHFLAIEDGVRESTQSWREVLLGMKQRAGPHDLGAERLHPSSQLRVGGVVQRRRPMRAFVQELHDSIVGSIAAAMPGVNHDEALGRRRHAGWLLPIEHDRPYASVAEGQRDDLGDEPSSGPGPIAPPAVRARAHDVIAVHEDSGLRRPSHAVLRSASCRRGCPETKRRPLPCQGAMILGAWGRDTMVMRIPGGD